MVTFYDVSMKLFEGMAIYPGNPEFKIEQYASIPYTETNENRICMGTHTGSHIDSKKHISNDGAGSLAIPLDNFYGKCNVIDVSDVGLEIHQKDLEKYPIQKGAIILLKTSNSKQSYNLFNPKYAHVKLDAAKYLVDKGVKTLGFDYLSVKKFQSDPDVHDILINNLTLFEGLDLSKISEGEYLFVGFPLKIDTDGSPARVILIQD